MVIQDRQTGRETINCLAVLSPSGSVLYVGSLAECYNFMLSYPLVWRELVYAFKTSTTLSLLRSAPIKLAELKLQYKINHAKDLSSLPTTIRSSS